MTEPTQALTIAKPASPALAGDLDLDSFAAFLRLDSAGGDPSPDTLRGYLSGARAFLAWAAPRGLTAATVTEDDVRAYRRELVERGQARATVAHRLAAVRRLFAACTWRGLRADNPAAGIRPPRRDRAEDRMHFLSLVELDRLLRAVPPDTLDGLRDRAMISLMGLHGLRSVEVHRANREDFARPEGAPAEIRVHGKTGERTVYLRADVADLLAAYLTARTAEGLDDRAMFVAHGNRSRDHRLSRRSLDTIANRYHEAAGSRHRGCHVLRHTSATLALAAGAGVEHVRAALGHASLTTTSVYVHALSRAENNPAELIGITV